ncbi:MAG: PHP domain-containing protein [Euryarchaeota archaeon]|nr:PHP domain-containing protein [Euryarchaeota archaeon]
MKALPLALAVLVLAGLLGYLVDTRPTPTVSLDNGTLVCGDLHTHTWLSYHPASPLASLINARRRGLDFIVATEHNAATGGPFVEGVARLFGFDILVVNGEEVTHKDYHLGALGIRESIPATLDILEAARRARAQGGLAVLNHPVRRYHGPGHRAFQAGSLDGIESHNIGPWREGNQWQVEEFAAQLARNGTPTDTMARLGVSDTHFGASTGEAQTCVAVQERTWPNIMAELQAGRTAPAVEGRFYGPGPLVQELNRNPQAIEKIGWTPPLWMMVLSNLILLSVVFRLLGSQGPWGRP